MNHILLDLIIMSNGWHLRSKYGHSWIFLTINLLYLLISSHGFTKVALYIPFSLLVIINPLDSKPSLSTSTLKIIQFWGFRNKFYFSGRLLVLNRKMKKYFLLWLCRQNRCFWVICQSL